MGSSKKSVLTSQNLRERNDLLLYIIIGIFIKKNRPQIYKGTEDSIFPYLEWSSLKVSLSKTFLFVSFSGIKPNGWGGGKGRALQISTRTRGYVNIELWTGVHGHSPHLISSYFKLHRRIKAATRRTTSPFSPQGITMVTENITFSWKGFFSEKRLTQLNGNQNTISTLFMERTKSPNTKLGSGKPPYMYLTNWRDFMLPRYATLSQLHF